jgi:hypothetical protein
MMVCAVDVAQQETWLRRSTRAHTLDTAFAAAPWKVRSKPCCCGEMHSLYAGLGEKDDSLSSLSAAHIVLISCFLGGFLLLTAVAVILFIVLKHKRQMAHRFNQVRVMWAMSE